MKNLAKTPLDCLSTKAHRDGMAKLSDEAPPLIIHLATWTNLRESNVRLPSWIILTSRNDEQVRAS